ncbi:hexose phosphate transporter [Carnobacterium divergens]|uniref:hexose-6-phosphate:phosphate antiporter n=1 Tax=Carnobacterium divergens TaxID=2748 RepID=UPI001072CBE2|nr:hexose-6-phosphate:phosphate antiporter [Carnobacterium divergens]TFJ45581.1 hexose phosphate transporter [Carnobacterium divergens]TFJ53376.1 hexose phosphate transporter [Carnobacterium divergens]TFJ58359.1 hexose phosphate transporter [Carnobacterium divergens]TFJ66481.1 hexose phosphate transporter [Carnobacterium divergens]TFJ74930.1 hexose phosphate transporter [Carnobacterium divergens]
MLDFLKNVPVPKSTLTISEQRKRWFKEFMKPFFVVVMIYITMYLIRNNFKAAQPLLKSQLGFTTTDLGYIGFTFSIVYGFGKFILGYIVDGKNTKKILSVLLFLSSLTVLCMGSLFTMNHVPLGWIVVLWSLNGLFQCVGGPSCASVITQWTTKKNRGRYIGLWNASHNIGGGLAGIFAIWCAQTFFKGNVAGMFILPAVVAGVIAVITFFIGKNRPEDLGWASSEEIFEEPVEEANQEAEDMTKWQIFKKYLLTNPWIWLLCVSNVFVYIVRIGIDNWAPLYVTEHLNFSNEAAANTIFYFEMGALVGCLAWGYISDFLKGRPALVATISSFLLPIGIIGYQFGTTELIINGSLFMLGMMIFGPQLLINISMLGFVPKKATVVAGGLLGAFAYLFGDSMAKILLAKISDPTQEGVKLFNIVLHGWGDTFIIFYIAVVIIIVLLGTVAFAEEKRIRQSKIEV